MGLRRTSLVLYILIIFHLQHTFPSVSSRPSSVDTNNETLPFNALKPDVGFEGKARQLAVVIKRGGGGGGRGGGGGGGRGGGSGGGRSRAGRVVPVHGGGTGGSHSSSASRNIRGAFCAVGWFGFSVLTSLFLVGLK